MILTQVGNEGNRLNWFSDYSKNRYRNKIRKNKMNQKIIYSNILHSNKVQFRVIWTLIVHELLAKYSDGQVPNSSTITIINFLFLGKQWLFYEGVLFVNMPRDYYGHHVHLIRDIFLGDLWKGRFIEIYCIHWVNWRWI